MVNVDLANMQFDVEAIYEEAQKLGIDAEDLQEFGFNKKNMCGDKKCSIDFQRFKDYDDMINKTDMMGEKVARAGSQAYKKAMCSPYFRDNIHPKVSIIWAMFPFDCCLGFGPVTFLLNGLFFPCIFPCIIPLYEWIVIPWNVFWCVGTCPFWTVLAFPFVGSLTVLNWFYQIFGFNI